MGAAMLFVAVVIAINVGLNSRGNNTSIYVVSLKNIEAWGQYQEQEAKGWYVWHFPCYNSSGRGTGKYSASSSYAEGGSHSSSHDHSCSDCSN
jgi:hypothetical protein